MNPEAIWMEKGAKPMERIARIVRLFSGRFFIRTRYGERLEIKKDAAHVHENI